MGGHGHHDPYSVPDYKIYKVEDVPLLIKTKKALEAQGLSDPWLRNEVWRYNVSQFGTERLRLKKTFLRGFGIGVVGVVITLAATALYDKASPSEHGHNKGHH